MAQDDSIANIPSDLVTLLTTGEFVLFLGAGTSISAGFHDWRGSLLALADQLVPFAPNHAALMRHEAEADRFLAAAELLYLAD